MGENGQPGTEKKLDELYELIAGIEVAMFTTRRADGHLVSRPMQTQSPRKGSDLYFVTNSDAHKLEELENDPHVNLAYYREKTREWVSVSGFASVSHDRALIHELYQPDWRAWFGDAGGERDGGPDDPRITLVLVEAASVVYMVSNAPRPAVLFEVLKGMMTGSRPDIGEVRRVEGSELKGG